MSRLKIFVSFEFDKDNDLRGTFTVSPRSIRPTRYRTSRFDKTIRVKNGGHRRGPQLASVTW